MYVDSSLQTYRNPNILYKIKYKIMSNKNIKYLVNCSLFDHLTLITSYAEYCEKSI